MSATRVTRCAGLHHAGLKGPGCAAWLAAQGLPVPQRPNTWLIHDSGLVALLGRGEYLVENREPLPALFHDGPGADGVVPLLRRDVVLLIKGPRLHDVLAEVCGVDLARAAPEDMVMTRLAGVSVIAAPYQPDGVQLWVDPSWADALQDILATVCDAHSDEQGDS